MARILIADDGLLTGGEIEEMLTDLGYDVVGQAESAIEAIDMARELSPDLIVMDVVMPGRMNGIDAAAQIKLDIPIIIISGCGDPEHVEKTKEIDPQDYVMKPFDEKEVRAFVEIAIHRRELQLKPKRNYEELKEVNRELAQEIAERKKTEERLLESEAKQRQLLNHAPAGICEVDFIQQRFIRVNDVICEYAGYTF